MTREKREGPPETTPLVRTYHQITTMHAQSVVSTVRFQLGMSLQFNSTSIATDVQARSRWLVAYTLIRNPSLLPLTASNLSRSPGRANLVSIAPTTTEPNSDELAMLAGTETNASTNW